MDFAEAFEAPVVETIRGTAVTFPVLWSEDYLPWIAQIKAEKKAKSLKLIPPKAAELDQFRMKRIIEFEEVAIEAIAEQVWTVPGAMKILDLSLQKAGHGEPDRKEIIRSVRPQRLCPLAKDVSALYEQRPTPQPGQQSEGGDPNSRSAEAAASSANPADAETGSQT